MSHRIRKQKIGRFVAHMIICQGIVEVLAFTLYIHFLKALVEFEMGDLSRLEVTGKENLKKQPLQVLRRHTDLVYYRGCCLVRRCHHSETQYLNLGYSLPTSIQHVVNFIDNIKNFKKRKMYNSILLRFLHFYPFISLELGG